MACFRVFGHRVCATGLRLSPGTNSHATCVGLVLAGHAPGKGQKMKVKTNFISASKGCKASNDDATKVAI